MSPLLLRWGRGDVDGSAEDMLTCNKWIQHAMSVSPFVGDEGALEKMVCSSVWEIDWFSFKTGMANYFRGVWEDNDVICCVVEDIVVLR